MKSAFVFRHFSWLFDCQSRILHFAIWLLFLVVSFLECGSKCRAVNKAEIRIYMAHDDLLLFAHSSSSPKKKNLRELSFYWQTLNSPEAEDQFNFNSLRSISTFCTEKFQLSALFGINWHALSHWACLNFCHMISF